MRSVLSTLSARLATGALFGLLTVWFAYPFVEAAMHDLEDQTRARLASPRATRLGFGVPREWVNPKGQ